MVVKFDRADHGMMAAIYRAIFAPLDGDAVPVVNTADTDEPIAAPESDAKRVAEEKAKRAEAVAHVDVLAEKFAVAVPAHEFSPAELQGYLLKNKRDPEGALAGVDQWVINTRKERKEKELREAEEKREAEEAAKKKEEEDKKKKDDEEKKKRRKDKKKEEAKRKRKEKRSKKESSTVDEQSSDSSDSSDSGSEAEEELVDKKDETTDKPEKVEVAAESGGGKVKVDSDDGQLAVDEAKTGVDSGYGTLEEELAMSNHSLHVEHASWSGRSGSAWGPRWSGMARFDWVFVPGVWLGFDISH